LGGLLSATAPLTQFSWNELFRFHLRDVARLRETLAGVTHQDASEADALRSLLIVGIRAPLGHFMAGMGIGEMGRPEGSLKISARHGNDFFNKVATAGMSRATLSSRLACLSLMASTGRIEQLLIGLQTMHAEGLRSWGTRHLEIEMLRYEGAYQRAFQMSIEQEEPSFWGELAAPRLRQLAAICREWRLPGMALPWLREWLDRFPDSPDSGLVWLDRSVNPVGLGPDLLGEARQAFETARVLLGTSVRLSELESWILRAEVDSERTQLTEMPQRILGQPGNPTPDEAPWPLIAEKIGRITDVVMVGQSRSTFILYTKGGRVVAKRMTTTVTPIGTSICSRVSGRCRPASAPSHLVLSSWTGHAGMRYSNGSTERIRPLLPKMPVSSGNRRSVY
jgi:hypothetical protein